MEAKLVVVQGADPVEIELFLPFLIGRAADAALKIPHDSVSREHCRIYEFDGELAVRDLDSRNGTYVNGQLIDRPTFLSPGDELTVGKITLRADYQIRRQVVLVPHAEADPASRQGKTSDAETSVLEATVRQPTSPTTGPAAKPKSRGDKTTVAKAASKSGKPQPQKTQAGQKKQAVPLPKVADTPAVIDAIPDLGLPVAPVVDDVKLQTDQPARPVGEEQLKNFLESLDEL